ncbi:mitogen-activated protein kinase kinase kinase 20-like [Alnus glutinosa]|uniref:mitogen-activated protein kinase kinase kinase 20-like n=1 Tax=Alnus glutinosa TaxID=3517 RepID=UPI002D76B1D6|nr:mitogen-activated protein kinase kinase kinase 20-like [Alnus glutinosa]
MKRPREEDGEHSLLCGEMSWCRGPMIGKGAFGSVYRAELKKPRLRLGGSRLTSVVAVKSADPSNGSSLLWEKTVLDALQGCPHVLQTFGADTTKTRNGDLIYNVLLEFASGGSLADLIVKSSGHGLSESDVRKHTKSMLVGLKHIHARGFVHCDLKPDNVLLVPRADGFGFEVKIADFGLAKRVNSCETPCCRGTPWYLAPECVIYGVQEAFSDIWALGCTVLVMLTGKVPWETITGSKEYEDLLSQIGSGSVPDIPDEISNAAKDFFKCCFAINPMDRMTADTLLDHPFLLDLDETDSSHVQASKEAENAKRNKCSPSYFPFGSRFIPLSSDFPSQEAEVPAEIQVSKEAENTSFPLGCSLKLPLSSDFPSQEAEVPEIQVSKEAENTSFPFGCSFIPLPDSLSEEEGEEEIQDQPAEQISFSAIFPKALMRSRPLAHWQHPSTFTVCAGA